MRLAYVTHATFPTPHANGVHATHMADALGRQLDAARMFAFCNSNAVTGATLARDYGLARALDATLIRRRRFPWKLRSNKRQLLGAINAFRPDVVYTRNVSFTLAHAQRIAAPFVVELHYLDEPITRFLQRAERYGTVGVVTITQALATEIGRRCPELALPVCVAPDAAPDLCAAVTDDDDDEARREIAQRIAQLHPAPRVGYAGSLLPGKGGDHVGALAAARPSVGFYVAGGTDEQVRALRERFARCDNLFLLGRLPYRQIAPLLAQMNVCLLPNAPSVILPGGEDIGPWTSPLKLFEYMSAGRAIIASDLPVLREVLTDDDNALLRPAGDVEAWAEAIDALCHDTARRERLARTARAHYVSRHTWSARARNVIAFLGGLPGVTVT